MKSSQRELKENELWDQLKNAIELRSAQDQVLWQILGLFWAACALLLVALFQSGNFPTSSFVGIIISGVGLALSVVSCFIQHRALGYIKRYEKLIERIENKLGFDPDYAVSGNINKKDYEEFSGKSPRARTVMTIFSFLAIFGWLVLFIYIIIFN